MRSESSIKTFIRIRPPASNAIFKEEDGVLNCCDKLYRFSHVFSPEATDEEIFEHIGFELVENTLNGLNSTLFAYGQTGTGKTYTMTGNGSKEGLVQRSVALLIRKLKNSPRFDYFSLKINYLQIYNEAIRDLLADKETKITIRQLAKSGFYVEGLESVEISDEESFAKELKRGLLKRSTKSTKMNEVSSRSHTILTVFLQVKIVDDEKGCLVRDSKLNFVDLAGSEKQKQTDVSGSKLKQASSINKSLTTLSLVISKLTEKQSKASHIPYRQSVLTKLLKDSIGGNSVTTFMGMISSQKAWVSQTVSTLLFLQRLKSVKNVVEINEKIEGKQEQLVRKINSQQEKIAQLEQQIASILKCYEECKEQLEQSQIQVKQLEERLMYPPPINTFFNQFQEDETLFFPETVLENQIDFGSSRQEKLSSIQEQGNESEEVKEKGRFQTEVKQNPNRNSRFHQKGSLKKSQKQRESKNFWRMENEFLRAQIKKYAEEDEIYANFIEMIAQNMSKFQFAAAQILIMQAQAEKLKRTQAHLQSYRNKFCQLALLNEKQQEQLKTQFFEVRSMEVDNISKKSKLISNENRLRQELQALKDKENESSQRINALQDSYRIQLFKLQEKNLSLLEAQQKANNEVRFLQDENIRLNAVIDLLRTELVHEDKSSSQSTQIEQLEEENEKLKDEIEVLKDMIEKDFLIAAKDQDQELKEKNALICAATRENELLNEALCNLQEELNQTQLKLAQNKAEMANIQQAKTPCHYLGGLPISFEELIQRYEQLSIQQEENRQEIERLRVTVASKLEELRVEEVKLSNEKESHKQAQTYFRYEIKVKNTELSKLKHEVERVAQECEMKTKDKDQMQQLVDTLQHKIHKLASVNAELESVQSVNRVLSMEVEALNRQIRELQRSNINSQELKKRYEDELSAIKLRNATLKEEKQHLQEDLRAAKGNFEECLKSLAKANQLYREEEYCFYRYKDEYKRRMEELKLENTRLMSKLAIRIT